MDTLTRLHVTVLVRGEVPQENKYCEMNTAKVTNRRQVRYTTIPDVYRDVDRLIEAHREGQLKTAGNWSPDQIFSHLAAWIEYGYDGYPVKPPFIVIRWIMKGMLQRYLRKGLPSGIKIPGVPQGTTGMDHAEIAAAAERLKQAFARLERGEVCTFDSPAFGAMSHADRIELNLRHAELHLSFLILDS